MADTRPFFFGANPATVDEGPQKGTRVLDVEEEMAVPCCALSQARLVRGRSSMCLPPADIVTGASQGVRLGAPTGVSMRELTAGQAKMLIDVIEFYAHRLRKELANEELSKLRAVGMENVFFAWAGGGERGQPHYYCVQGSTFIIDYDNAQGLRQSHSYCVARLDHDFGLDPLHAHYLTSSHRRQLRLAH